MNNLNETTGQIIDAGITVHKILGPGLLEKVYHQCLLYELELGGLKVVSELDMPLKYKNKRFDTGFRLDLLGEGSIVVEIKAVSDINPVFKSQLLTYLKLSDLKLGLLLNFNVPLFKNGITRLIN